MPLPPLFHLAHFALAAAAPAHFPPDSGREAAFAGRSNAGKSSAINLLLNQRGLARTSKLPGRTREVVFFALDDTHRLADLPGYGYAAVERSAKLRWQRVMADYLQQRQALAGVVLLVDARLGITALDERLLALLAPRLACAGVRLLVLLTKADKLNRREGQLALRRAEQLLGGFAADDADIGVALFSSLDRTGVDDVAAVLHGWRAGAVGEPTRAP